MNQFTKAWPVIFRAFLYFMIAALPVFLNEIKPFADDEMTPHIYKLLWIVGTAIVSGLIALRAFYDGTVQRHKDENSDNNSNL